ncbi:MAG: hybrid sensor histidine kinase/response regulator, partial [Anaerolineales bacterium]|nr:hybrid sensor histidine kinase/response regulator [Anaerolineales bacterium]
GIRKAKENLPNLIVSDVMMPAIDGFEMHKQMSADPQLASIPFIFLTARTSVDDRISGIRDGADDYIAKPFVIDELLARIESLLRRVHAEQERGREQVKSIALEEMNKLRKEVLQNFRHELRTPLGNVVMSLEMAVNNKYEDPQAQTEFIRIALSSADRLESLIADIILLSDIDQNDLNRIRQAIDVEHHILAPIQKRLQHYPLKELNFMPDIKLNGDIQAPRREFAQALAHLADNAFKFSPEHGRVELTVRSRENGGAVITMQDEGIGIPVDLREKVFERFFQISQGDQREYQGLGIGLTVARTVFFNLGGEVKILDCEKGCRVEATLPDLRPEDITYG